MQREDISRPIIASPKECTGCSACASVCPQKCIKMATDSFGFFHASIDYGMCINCKACESVCPVVNGINPLNSRFLSAFAGYSLREDIRESSSSGGVFTEIGEYMLDRSGVVFGAAFDENYSVNHICVDNPSDLRKLRGAKYSQSKLNNTYQEVRRYLDFKRPVLFSGTPCQVAGLKRYLRKEYSNLLCVDFVCHGVTSPNVWDRYVQYRAQIDNNGVLPYYINLRDKESGWSHYKYSVHFQYKDHFSYKGLNGQDEFTRLYASNGIINLPCTECKFKGLNRASDITIGDFWGIWDVCPEIDDRKGVSLIICNSNSGKECLKGIEHNISIKEVTIKQATGQNASYYESTGLSEYRSKILGTVCNEGITESIAVLDSIPRKLHQDFIHRFANKMKFLFRQNELDGKDN